VKNGTELTVAEMCKLSDFSRAGYYRSLTAAPKQVQEDLKLRDAMHTVALDWPAYGSRRMKRELKKLGWKVNRKRVQRLMREDNLLCVAKRKFVVTTDSAHPLPVYPNLPPSMEVKGINHLWIADITYIRLEEEFIYLAVILDAHSRRVIGWSLDDTMAESLTAAALKMALSEREVPPDGRIERELFGRAEQPSTPPPPRPLPDFASIHDQLRQHRHLTLQLLWVEYRQAHPDGYGYSHFCDHYQKWRRKIDVVLRQEHKAGEKLFVDWAGQMIPVHDRTTSLVSSASLFVAVLGASSYNHSCRALRRNREVPPRSSKPAPT
jgi:hypothetical protein